MIKRRDLAGLVGLGATAAAVGALSTSASAQTAHETTWERIMRTKKLRTGGVTTGAPWTMKDVATGEWNGHFYHIAKTMAEDMDVELEVVETQWGNAIMDLQANKIDIMFGMNLTPTRALAVDFTDTVYDSALVVIARHGFEPVTWEDMNNPDCRIAVDVGTAHDHIVSRLCPNATISRLRSLDEASMTLRSGRADVQCLFWMGALRAVKRDEQMGHVVVPQPQFGATSNACVRREQDKTFRDYANAWISYSRNMGLIRSLVIESLEAVDLTTADIPEGISL
ncbi:transporter substrate-binding domain-containing protein [Aerobium aerolatum]|uniref:Polar amino acid transport system substrate-binding protein n=1 Tax=Aquamicrobium aerolatum DSM 21857 TaxID=1121003 RepID=A0A1I3R826_9HYPH|nr:transporter substrate-binding domain-containing protein [Aquamicrobium aerolatum]SFJ42180.1 polar amino acid transport system substrate-binding protein [Aquamicrobium aerolatum DSM 21857]